MCPLVVLAALALDDLTRVRVAVSNSMPAVGLIKNQNSTPLTQRLEVM